MNHSTSDPNDAAQTLRTKLEKHGIENQYLPGEHPTEQNEWHYTTDHNRHSIIDSTGKPRHPSKTYGEKTRLEYNHSTNTHSWHCGTLTISYAHEPAHPDRVEYDDVEPENAVYGAYVYIRMNWIKPVEERRSEHDRRRTDRTELLAVNADTPITTDEILDAFTTGQELLTTNAEATDDTDRQERIDRAERHWSDEKNEYILPDDEDQAMLNVFA